MNNFLRRAANVVMVLSLAPWVAYVGFVANGVYRGDVADVLHPGVIGMFALISACIWVVGYLLDGRMPWQIIRKGD